MLDVGSLGCCCLRFLSGSRASLVVCLLPAGTSSAANPYPQLQNVELVVFLSTFFPRHSSEKVEEFITRTKDMRSKKARALSLARWKSMKFSADGQSILISTDANLVLTLHAFEGDVKQASIYIVTAVFLGMVACSGSWLVETKAFRPCVGVWCHCPSFRRRDGSPWAAEPTAVC